MKNITMSGAGGGITANTPPNPILTQSSQFSRIRQSRPISANQVIRTNTSDYQRMHEKAQIKCREMQSCLAYLQDSGRLQQLQEIIHAIYVDEKLASQQNLAKQDPHQHYDPGNEWHERQPSQQPAIVIDTTEILRANLKDILGMAVDDVWHQNQVMQQAGGLPPRHRQMESSALTESNRSLRNSAGNTSKLTPHSISKMNITELKQSLSQTLNRDFIEPATTNGQKSAKPTTPWNASRTIQQSRQYSQEVDPLIMASQKLNAEIIAELSGAASRVPNLQQDQTRKDMIIDDFSSSSEQEDEEDEGQELEKHTHQSDIDGSQSLLMVSNSQAAGVTQLEDPQVMTPPQNHLDHHHGHQDSGEDGLDYPQGIATIHRVNMGDEQVILLRDYGKSGSSRMNVDPVSYNNSVNRVALNGTIGRGKGDNSSDCYTANKPLSENNSETVPNGLGQEPIRLGSENFQTPQQLKQLKASIERNQHITHSSEDRQPQANFIINEPQLMLRQDGMNHKLLAINLLSQENSCIKQAEKSQLPKFSNLHPHQHQDLTATLKFTSQAPSQDSQLIVFKQSHKAQESYTNINPVSEEDSSNYYKQQKGAHQSESSGNLPNLTGSKNSAQDIQKYPSDPQMDFKLKEIMLKNIWEIENNPMFCLNSHPVQEGGAVPPQETEYSNYDMPLQYQSQESPGRAMRLVNEDNQLHFDDLEESDQDSAGDDALMMYPEEVDDVHLEELRRSKRTVQKQRYQQNHNPPALDDSIHSSSQHDSDFHRPTKSKRAQRVPATKDSSYYDDRVLQQQQQYREHQAQIEGDCFKTPKQVVPEKGRGKIPAAASGVVRQRNTAHLESSAESDIYGIRNTATLGQFQSNTSHSYQEQHLQRITSNNKGGGGISDDSPSNWIVLGTQNKGYCGLSDVNQSHNQMEHHHHLKSSSPKQNQSELGCAMLGGAGIRESAQNIHNAELTTQNDSNSLFIPAAAMSQSSYNQQQHQQYQSNEPPTSKISAEDLIRNYANANFMPQKQAHDRLHLLCQSRELNPLVSLTLDPHHHQQPQQPNGHQQNTDKSSARFGANSYLSSSASQHMANSSETKKQYSSSVKSSVGNSNQNGQGNLVTIQGIISLKQGGMGDSLRQQSKSKTPARESAAQKSRNTGPRYQALTQNVQRDNALNSEPRQYTLGSVQSRVKSIGSTKPKSISSGRSGGPRAKKSQGPDSVSSISASRLHQNFPNITSSSHPRSTKALNIKGLSHLTDSPGSSESITNRLRKTAQNLQQSGAQSEYPMMSMEQLVRKRNTESSKQSANEYESVKVLRKSKDSTNAVKKSLSPIKQINNSSKLRNINIAGPTQSSVDLLKQQVSNLLQLENKNLLIGSKFRLSRSSEGTNPDDSSKPYQPQQAKVKLQIATSNGPFKRNSVQNMQSLKTQPQSPVGNLQLAIGGQPNAVRKPTSQTQQINPQAIIYGKIMLKNTQIASSQKYAQMVSQYQSRVNNAQVDLS